MQKIACIFLRNEYNIIQGGTHIMRNTCPYCKLMMVPVYRFSKKGCDYLLKCNKCHLEVKGNNLSSKDNASNCYRAILGVANGS